MVKNRANFATRHRVPSQGEFHWKQVARSPLRCPFNRRLVMIHPKDDVYERLAEHLDRLPAGFPSTATGVEIRILKRLFTPLEAEVAQLVTLRPEKAPRIAERSRWNPKELEEHLFAMSKKGLIFRIRKGSEFRYMAAQFVIGIWEYHVNDLDPDLIRDVNEYLPHFFHRKHQASTPQLRTIPISGALPSGQAVMPYEKARQLVRAQEKIVVAPCICRKEHQLTGGGCGKPMETCLVFGNGATYYEENGLGRPISTDEALEILASAEEHGLVLQPSNAQSIVNICTCCDCCCQILKNLKVLPNPGQYVACNFVAQLSESLCSGCGACAASCPMDALRLDHEKALLMPERCIGCGVCVPVCPEEALALAQKPEEERITPPAHLLETFKKIHGERMSKLKALQAQPGDKS